MFDTQHKLPTNINSIDYLRGIASVMVALFHFAAGNRIFLPEDNILKEITRYGWVGVEIFFIISGLVIPYSMVKSGYKIQVFFKFLARRIVRIDPPYILSIIFSLLLAYASTLSGYYRGKPFELDWLQIVLHLGYLNAFFDLAWLNPVYWSLAIEFQYYIIIALSFPLIFGSNKVKRYTFFIIFALIGFLIPQSRFIFHFALLFIIGFSLFLYKTKQINKIELIISLIVLVAGVFFNLGSTIFFATVFTIIFILFVQAQKPLKLLSFFGKISYSLYLIHVPLGGRIINLVEQFIDNELYRSLSVFVALIISVLSAWLFYIIIEKWSIQLSKKIVYSKKENETLMIKI